MKYPVPPVETDPNVTAAESATTASVTLPPQSTRTPSGAGRPTRLTPEAAESILTDVRNGSYREVAARHAGVAPETLSRWLKRPGEPYETFRRQLDEAEADLEVRLTNMLVGRAEGRPELALSILERKFPQRWSRVTTASGTAQVNIDLGKMLETIYERRRTIPDPRGPRPRPAPAEEKTIDGTARVVEVRPRPTPPAALGEAQHPRLT